MSSTDDEESLAGVPLIEGTVAGIAAFVVGYVLTYVLAVVDSEFGGHESDSAFELLGIVFYNAHFVEGEFTASAGGFVEGTERFNLIAEESTQLPEPVFYLVPIVLLVAAGYLVGNRALEASAEPTDGVVAGGSVVLGYLPLALIGTVLFEASDEVSIGDVSFSATFAPDPLMSVVFVGLVYPLVFGAIGGALASR